MLDSMKLREHPAVKEMVDYCADAPAILLGEGFWDDMENAYGCGLIEAGSRAAQIMRQVLTLLGIDPPAGVECCDECDRMIGIDGVEHAPDCSKLHEADEKFEAQRDDETVEWPVPTGVSEVTGGGINAALAPGGE